MTGRRALAAIVAMASITFAAALGTARAAGTTDSTVTYQVNAAHTGAISGDTLTTPLMQAWSRNLGGEPEYPLIANGMVYVVAGSVSQSSLYALDEHTGNTVWSQPVTGSYHFALIAYDAGKVFAVNHDGLATAYDATTGATLWSAQLPGESSFTSPPTASNGVLYDGGAGSGGLVYAVRETDGSIIWTSAVMNGDNSSPTLSGNGDVYVSYSCPQTYDFSQTSGTPIWHYSGPCEGGGGNTSVLYNGSLYVVDGVSSPKGYVFNATTGGNPLSRFDGSALPAFSGNEGVFLSGSSYYTGGTLRGQDLTTGSSLWSFTGDGYIFSNPLIVNSTVYAASMSGTVYALDLASGQQKWSGSAGTAINPPGNGYNYGMGAGDGYLAVPTSTGLTVFTTTPASTLKGTTAGAAEGKPLSGTVATFTDPGGNGTGYSATISWGDGASSAGTITASGSGTYTVTGSHTYSEEGSYTATTTVSGLANPPNPPSVTSAITVSDASISAQGASLTGTARTGISYTVASFTDSDPGCAASDYTVSISWGDGTSSRGTASASSTPCTFAATGQHTYAKAGTYTIATTITDAGGASSNASSTVTVRNH